MFRSLHSQGCTPHMGNDTGDSPSGERPAAPPARENREAGPASLSNRHLFYGMAALAGLCVVFMILLIFTGPSSGRRASAPGSRPSPPGASGPASAPRTAPEAVPRQREDAPGKTLYARVEALLEKGNLDQAELLLGQAPRQGEEWEKLRARLARARKEREAHTRYLAYLDSAERAAAAGRWALAAENYASARAVKDAPGLKEKIFRARFHAALARAERFLERGKTAEAYREAQAAFGMDVPAPLKARARMILDRISAAEEVRRQRKRYAAYTERAEERFAAGDYRGALSLFTAARDYTVTDAQDAHLAARITVCREKMRAREKERRFARLVAEAEAAEKANEREKALALYREALRVYPGKEKVAAAVRRLSLALLPPTITDKTGITMKLVPAGRFTRGSTLGKADDRIPVRRIYVSAFYIDACEITNAQYEKFDPSHVRSPYSPGDDTPVTNVSWEDAQRYCAWRSKMNNAVYRLPTEAEWEKAAKGGDDRPFSWGFTFDARKGCAALSSRRALPAASLEPNPYGLYHMSGNVWEWCLDWYDPRYYRSSPVSDPPGPDTGTYRVVRGGSFRSTSAACRTYERNAEKPGTRVFDIGFRTVRLVTVSVTAGGEKR